MSGQNYNKPQIIAIDGLHRCGKGTQISLLQKRLKLANLESITMRGDGSRSGEGNDLGDPYNKTWQNMSQYLRSSIGDNPENWNYSTSILIRELGKLALEQISYDYILLDRSFVSRATYLMSKGITPIDDRYTIPELYNNNSEDELNIALPSVLFHLKASAPEILISRLSPNDPKYEFRKRNIMANFAISQCISRSLPEDLSNRVIEVDADQSELHIEHEIFSIIKEN